MPFPYRFTGNTKGITGITPLLQLYSGGERFAFDPYLGQHNDYMHHTGNIVKHVQDALCRSPVDSDTRLSAPLLALANKTLVQSRRADTQDVPLKALNAGNMNTYDRLSLILVGFLPALWRVATDAVVLAMSFYIIAMRILLNPHTASVPGYQNIAESLLHEYVRRLPGVFGPTYSTLTQHQCLHTVDIVRRLGYMKAGSCFGFENANKVMGQHFTGSQEAQVQIARRITMRNSTLYLASKHIDPKREQDKVVAALLGKISSPVRRALALATNETPSVVPASTWRPATGPAGGWVSMKTRKLLELPVQSFQDYIDNGSIHAGATATQFAIYTSPTGITFRSELGNAANRYSCIMLISTDGGQTEGLYVATRFILVEGSGTFVEAEPLTRIRDAATGEYMATPMLLDVLAHVQQFFGTNEGSIGAEMRAMCEEIGQHFVTCSPRRAIDPGRREAGDTRPRLLAIPVTGLRMTVHSFGQLQATDRANRAYIHCVLPYDAQPLRHAQQPDSYPIFVDRSSRQR